MPGGVAARLFSYPVHNKTLVRNSNLMIASGSSERGRTVISPEAKGDETMVTEMLGMMITKYENFDHIAGIVKATRATGKSVMIFMTDEGVRFTTDPKFLDLTKIDGVEFSCCDHSCELLGIHEKSDSISYGSQYNNAGMLHDSTRVLVF